MRGLESRIKKLEARTPPVQSIVDRVVVGFVCPKKGFTHSITNFNHSWVASNDEPTVYLPAKLERALTSTKRFIIIIGGRGSGKSVGVADICLIHAMNNDSKTYCLREYQSSIKNSVHSLIKEEAKRLEFDSIVAQTQSILKDGRSVFEFAGIARNVDSIKSAHGFARFEVEEAQFISENSLKVLTPTARQKPKKGLPTELETVIDDQTENVSMFFVANPGSSEDPFSKRFINDFRDTLDRDGIYEDDLHLVIEMNYYDNPWYGQSGLDEERQWDFEHLSRAYYDHIWEGAFNDSVDDAIIMAEWFDACIDAHLRLGFQPTGAKVATHDPSDLGPDSKGYAFRHGSVFLDIQEKLDGDVNEGGHWAADLAKSQGANFFKWDCGGMGLALNEQMSLDFKDCDIEPSMFDGAGGVEFPEAVYQPALKAPVAMQKQNKDSFKNARAQNYFKLRDRIYRTFRAVVYGEYCDPDEMISFSSEIECIGKLRSELCRLPKKPNSNNKFELYTKEEMKAKFKLKSPNLADSVMMSMSSVIMGRRNKRQLNTVMPQPIRTFRRR